MWLLLWFLPVHAQNLASWIPLTASAQSLVVPAASNLGVFRANVNATRRLNAARPDLVPSPSAPLFIINGGYDYADEYFRFPEIWTLRQTSETEYEWNILASNQTTGGVWPVDSDGHDWRQLANGDFLRFGGTDLATYLNSLWVFDTSSLQWILVEPELAPGSPQPRAWGYMQSLGLTGVGDDERFMIYGGNGASDNIFFSREDRDLDDAQILTIGKTGSVYHANWQAFNSTNCTSEIQTCADSQAPSDQFTAVRALFDATYREFTQPVRPSQWQSNLNSIMAQLVDLQQYFNGINGTNATQNALGTVDDDASCSSFCDKAVYSEHYPQRKSATRFVVYGRKVFLMGGYSCTVQGSIIKGGDNCYDNSMFIYDIPSNSWTQLTEADATDEQKKLWPSGRSYHMAVLMDNKMWIVSGAYLTVQATYEYLNDVYVFNCDTLLWEAVDVRGVPPMKRWDASGDVDGSDIWFIYGITAETLHDDVWMLAVGRSVEADNFYAFGPDLSSTLAGNQSMFSLQARHIDQTGPNLTFSDNIAWGVGLESLFDVTLLSTREPTPANGFFTAQVRLEPGSVVSDPQGGGLYQVRFTPKVGPTALLFVLYNDEHIPGSPFRIVVNPSPVTAASLSYVTGFGGAASVRNQMNDLTVQVSDEFGNPSADMHTAIVLAVGTPGNVLASTVTTFSGNGVWMVTYVSPDQGAFLLYVRVNGQDISGSPFQVTNYNPLGVHQAARTTMIVLTALAQCVVAILMVQVFRYRRDTAFKGATPLFIQIMLWGLMLALSSIYAFASPSDSTCRAFPFMLGVAFVVIMGALYIKTWRLMIIFRQREMKIIAISIWRMSLYLLVLVAVEVGFNLTWLLYNGPKLMRMVGDPQPLSYDECSGDNFSIWQLASFAYKGVFLFYGIFLAFMTRRLPVAFNESAWIGVSIYNVAISVLIVLPVVYGGKTQDNLTAIFVITCAAIIWAVLFMACALTLPKIYHMHYGVEGGTAMAGSTVGRVHVSSNHSVGEADTKGNVKHSDSESRLPAGGRGSTDGGGSHKRVASAEGRSPTTPSSQHKALASGGSGGSSGPSSASPVTSPVKHQAVPVDTNTLLLMQVGQTYSADFKRVGESQPKKGSLVLQKPDSPLGMELIPVPGSAGSAGATSPPIV